MPDTDELERAFDAEVTELAEMAEDLALNLRALLVKDSQATPRVSLGNSAREVVERMERLVGYVN